MKKPLMALTALLTLLFSFEPLAAAPLSSLAQGALQAKRAQGKPVNDQPYDLLLYLNANSHPSNLQMPRMMADMAAMGVTKIAILPQLYFEFSAQGLNSVAQDWSIGIIVNGAFDVAPGTKQNDAEIKAAFKACIDRINSYEGGKAVVGYGIGDEVEGSVTKDKVAEVSRHYSRSAKLLNELDPKRFTFLNHVDISVDETLDGKLLRTGETFTGCSVFWANHFAENRLVKLRQRNEEAGLGRTPQLAIYGAQGTATALVWPKLITQNKLVGITIEQIRSVSMADDLYDYMTVPFSLGFAGSGLFAYDAYYDYTWYSILDERGRSKDGRREAILKGMEAIRAAEGCPALELTVTREEKGLGIKTRASHPSERITDINAEVSYDGGTRWEKVPGISVATPDATLQFTEIWMRSGWTMIRATATAANGKKSLVRVWNTFPWTNPKPS